MGNDSIAIEPAQRPVGADRAQFEIRAWKQGRPHLIIQGVFGLPAVETKVGVIFVESSLLFDDQSFAGDLVGGKGGMEDQLPEPIEGWGQVLRGHPGIESGSLRIGPAVGHAAQSWDEGMDGFLIPPFCAGEDEVLDKVRNTGGLGIFIPRTNADDQHGNDRPAAGQGLAPDAQT